TAKDAGVFLLETVDAADRVAAVLLGRAARPPRRLLAHVLVRQRPIVGVADADRVALVGDLVANGGSAWEPARAQGFGGHRCRRPKVGLTILVDGRVLRRLPGTRVVRRSSCARRHRFLPYQPCARGPPRVKVFLVHADYTHASGRTRDGGSAIPGWEVRGPAGLPSR